MPDSAKCVQLHPKWASKPAKGAGSVSTFTEMNNRTKTISRITYSGTNSDNRDPSGGVHTGSEPRSLQYSRTVCCLKGKNLGLRRRHDRAVSFRRKHAPCVSLGGGANTGFPVPLVPPMPPEPVKFPRARINQRFAVLLLRSVRRLGCPNSDMHGCEGRV